MGVSVSSIRCICMLGIFRCWALPLKVEQSQQLNSNRRVFDSIVFGLNFQSIVQRSTLPSFGSTISSNTQVAEKTLMLSQMTMRSLSVSICALVCCSGRAKAAEHMVDWASSPVDRGDSVVIEAAAADSVLFRWRPGLLKSWEELSWPWVTSPLVRSARRTSR